MARLPELPCVVRPIATASLDDDGAEWEVAVFPVIDGATPSHPWTAGDTVRVLDAVVDLGAQLTPSPWPDDPVRGERLQAFFRGWGRLARDDSDSWRGRRWVAEHLGELLTIEAELVEQLPGDTLSHCDLRADNVMLDEDRVWFVDWAHAGNAARWLDPLLVLCDVVVSGADVGDGGDVDITAVIADHRAFDHVPERIVVGVMASLAATLHRLSNQPDPPGLPTLRRFQDLTAEALLGLRDPPASRRSSVAGRSPSPSFWSRDCGSQLPDRGLGLRRISVTSAQVVARRSRTGTAAVVSGRAAISAAIAAAPAR